MRKNRFKKSRKQLLKNESAALTRSKRRFCFAKTMLLPDETVVF